MLTKLKLLFWIFAAGLLYFSQAAHASEFTWFSNVDGREGWIEFATATSDGQNRIHIFPKLLGANGSDTRAKTESRPDGVYISFVLKSDAPTNAQDFIRKVLKVVSGLPNNKSTDYQINIPNINFARVRVVSDGVTLGERIYNAKLSSQTVDGIKVITSDVNFRNNLLNGNYRLEADITLPQATYSSLAISINNKMATSYKIEALKTIVTQQLTSGGRFLFFDWRRQSAQNTVTQSINQTRASSASHSTSVLSVDADDAMLAKVESLLGFNELSREDVKENHLRAAKVAESAKNFDLAKLHREYAEKIDDKTPRVQAELLQKAIQMLGGNQSSLAGFIANGIQFSESSGTGVSRFSGLGTFQEIDNSNSDYTELKLTSRNVNYLITSGPFEDSDAIPPLPQDGMIERNLNGDDSSFNQALLDAVQNNNLAQARRALQKGALSNVLNNMNQTPLMLSARKCNMDITSLLLEADANPTLRDINYKNARDLANLSGCRDVASKIDNVDLVNFKLTLSSATERTKLISFAIEDRGAIFYGGLNSLTIKTATGQKMFRLLVKMRMALLQKEYESFANMPYVSEGTHATYGKYRVYELEDVVRYSPFLAVNSEKSRTIFYKMDTGMAEITDGTEAPIVPSDILQRMNDRQHFGIGLGNTQPVGFDFRQ